LHRVGSATTISNPFPKQGVASIPRHLAIGDIHGCYNALRALLTLVEPGADDVIITLGDYVGKGPDTRAVIDELLRLDRAHRLIPLCGNHELLMLEARLNKEAYHRWIRSGGDATLRSYAGAEDAPDSLCPVIPEAHWHFLEHRLLSFHETDSHFFVHAGVRPDLSLPEQSKFMLYHKKFVDPPPHASGKIMVCGHTPQKSGLPASNGHAICLDTLYSGHGWLSCLHVESGIFYQANQAGQTRRLRLANIGF